jgi:hypothetical protein
MNSCSYPKAQRAFPSQGQGNIRILKTAYFLENYIEMRTGNFIIFKVDALMHAVLSQAEKPMPYRELVGTNKTYTVKPDVLHKLRLL